MTEEEARTFLQARSSGLSSHEDYLAGTLPAWTVTDLQFLRTWTCKRDEDDIVKALGRTRRELELARWALLGRTAEQAAAILNGSISEGGGRAEKAAPRLA